MELEHYAVEKNGTIVYGPVPDIADAREAASSHAPCSVIAVKFELSDTELVESVDADPESIEIGGLPIETVRGLLCSAFEGGSNYWYGNLDFHPAPGTVAQDYREGGKLQGADYWHPCELAPTIPGAHVTFDDVSEIGPDDGPPKPHRLDCAKLAKGAEVMRRKYPHHYANAIAGDGDAETGDVFLQCCTFGELIYG